MYVAFIHRALDSSFIWYSVMDAQGKDRRGPPSAEVDCRVPATPTGVLIRVSVIAPLLTDLLFVHNELYITLFVMFCTSRLNLFSLGL